MLSVGVPCWGSSSVSVAPLLHCAQHTGRVWPCREDAWTLLHWWARLHSHSWATGRHGGICCCSDLCQCKAWEGFGHWGAFFRLRKPFLLLEIWEKSFGGWLHLFLVFSHLNSWIVLFSEMIYVLKDQEAQSQTFNCFLNVCLISALRWPAGISASEPNDSLSYPGINPALTSSVSVWLQSLSSATAIKMPPLCWSPANVKQI